MNKGIGYFVGVECYSLRMLPCITLLIIAFQAFCCRAKLVVNKVINLAGDAASVSRFNFMILLLCGM